MGTSSPRLVPEGVRERIGTSRNGSRKRSRGTLHLGPAQEPNVNRDGSRLAPFAGKLEAFYPAGVLQTHDDLEERFPLYPSPGAEIIGWKPKVGLPRGK